jgi:hypothetical protein
LILPVRSGHGRSYAQHNETLSIELAAGVEVARDPLGRKLKKTDGVFFRRGRVCDAGNAGRENRAPDA